MATTYPECITDDELCSKCYASESCMNCFNGSGDHGCSAYCDSGCNTICDVAQTFCYNGVETVVDHADITKWPYNCYVKDEFIFRNWRSAMWNERINQLTKAAGLGLVCKQSQSSGGIPSSGAFTTPDPQNFPHPANSLVTADKYNKMVARINYFRKSLSTVKGAAEVGCEAADVIRGTHAMALYNGFNSMKFNTNVCDVCNAGNENRNDCNCDCDCDCTCDCDCYCNCSYSGE